MYHRWHFNHPYLILAMVLLAVWVVVYTVINFGGFEFASLFSGPTEYAAAPASEYAGAPGFRVPLDYYVQEKTYVAPESFMMTVSPGYVVPRDYFIQEKTYVAPESFMMTVSPGYVVPRTISSRRRRTLRLSRS
ncbi:MAG: hypothetical protein IPK16_02940 [Anaerolineales bacterium]|nr:hypothetical protein [Anaerolineales bacterium]